jgi:hypothetical protein
MALNIAIDLILGAIPLVGDLFDVYWKSNQRNVDLLRRHIEAGPATARKLRWGDRLFVVGLALGLCVLVIASAAVAFLIAKWLIASMSLPGDA